MLARITMNRNQRFLSNARELLELIRLNEDKKEILEAENLIRELTGDQPKHLTEIKEINERIERLWQACYKLPQLLNAPEPEPVNT